MPIDEPVELDVVVILAEWVDQHLGHFQPPHVETKLQQKHFLILLSTCEHYSRSKKPNDKPPRNEQVRNRGCSSYRLLEECLG